MATELVADVITREQLIEAMQNLPADSLGELCDFVTFLQWKARTEAGKAVKIGRQCRDLPAITDDEVNLASEEAVNVYAQPDTAN